MKKLLTISVLAAGLMMPLSFTIKAEPTNKHERHPEIQDAIHALETAKNRLEHANHDFGGHREDALKACDKAIEQLRLALKFDK